MNSLVPAIAGGVVRAVLPFLAAKGIDLDNEQVEQLMQAGVVLLTIAWTVVQKFSQKAKVEKAAVTGVVPV